MSRTDKQKIGDLGEGIACNYLEDKNYKILDRNYWKPWGEIDIVASKNNIVYFVEVKTVTHENLGEDRGDVARETSNMAKNIGKEDVTRENNTYNPADNIHPWKLKRLSKVIQTYILSHNIENDWEFSAIIVNLNIKDKKAKINHIKDIVLG